MTTPYIAVHGFIIDGTVTNSHADLTVAVRNGLRVEVVDGAVLGMLFPDGIPEELLTFVEPMYELSFETGLLSCLDSTVSTGAFDAWLELPEVVQYRYRCLPRVRVKVVSRVILNVSQIMLGVTSIAEKIGIDFAKSQKDFVYATDESDFTLVALLGLSSTIPFYSHSGGVDGNGFEVHLSLLPSEVSAAAKYTLLATADLRDENAIYETAYSSSSLTGYILDSNELMPVVYVREESPGVQAGEDVKFGRENIVQPLKADVSALLSIPRRTDPVHAKATVKQVNEFIATLPKRDDLSGKQQLCAYLYTLLPFVNGFHDTPRPFTINFLTSNANEEPSLSLKVGNWHTFIMEEHAKAFVPWCAEAHGGASSPACPDEIMLFFQANLPREEAMVCNSERSVLGAMNRNLLARSLSSETQHLELIADPDPRIRFYFAVHSAKRTLVNDWKWVTTARYGEFDSSRTSVVLATANNWLHKGGKEVTVMQHLFNSGWIRPPYWFRQEI